MQRTIVQGGILVTVVLNTDEAVGELSQALMEGHISLRDLDKRNLTVPRQAIQVLRQTDAGKFKNIVMSFVY